VADKLKIPIDNPKFKAGGVTINIVELSSLNASKISNINLHTGLAEVTRICKAQLKGGDNKVALSGLPNTMVHESLRCVCPKPIFRKTADMTSFI